MNYPKRLMNGVSRGFLMSAGMFVAILFMAFLCLGPGRTFGQTFMANLSGVVTDPAGAVIPGVEITIKNNATQDIRQTTSGPDGTYIFSNLLPGDYEVTATAKGFRTFVQRDVTLLAARSADLSFAMQIGELAQTVEVTGTAVLLDTHSANNTSTLTSTMVTELPTNTRNPFNFVFALAGTVESAGRMYSSSNSTDQNFNGFALNGGRSFSSQILLDGAPATAADWGGLLVSPTVDAVQEMQVVRNTYDAQYGMAGGGIITLVSKGGTNKFHGEGYEFLRAENLDATSWWSNKNFSPADCFTEECNKSRKGEFKRHQFGGNLGGPIWDRKHVYFFAAYEGLREPSMGSGTLKVPTDLERHGDFSQTYNPDGTLAVIYNPFSTVPDPSTPGQYLRTAFDPSCVGVVYPDTCPGNVIPSNLLDSVGQKVAALYPSPNRSGLGPERRDNFFHSSPARTTNDKVEGRIDWAHNEKHRMFGRWSQRLRQNYTPNCLFCNGADGNTFNNNSGFHFTLDNTFTPSANWVVTVLLGLGRSMEEQIAPAFGRIDASAVGLNPADYNAPILPAFSIADFSSMGTAYGQKIRRFPRYNNSLQVNFTKEHGRHSFKFGWMGESSIINNVDHFSGNFEFGRGMTSGPIAAGDSTTTGNGLASLLLGTAASGNTQFNPDISGSLRYYGWYLQDTWRATPRFTVILGTRYEIQKAMTERFNRLSYFNPSIANPLGGTVGLPLVGAIQYASATNRGGWSTDYNNLAPRIGLAYRVKDKLVLRAGYGIFYSPASSMFTFDSPGQYMGFATDTQMLTSIGGGGLIPENLLGNPYPNGLMSPTGSADGLMTGIGGSPFQIWPSGSHPTGYKQHFSFDAQYELGPGSVLELGYSGYRARKLMWGNPSLNANQLNPQYFSLGPALNELVPNPFYGHVPDGTFLSEPEIAYNRLLRTFPQFDAVQWSRSWPGAKANYDAFDVKFTRQFQGGLTLLSTYQWSKTMDNASEDYLGWATQDQWRDYFNRNAEYSISSHDMPQSFVTALVYQLPFGKGKRFGSSLPGALNHIVGGWQTSSVVRFSTGLPMLPVIGANIFWDYGFVWGYQNLVGNPSVDHRTAARWFNTEAFETPANFTLGNGPRYDTRLREEGAKNVDFGLMKTFQAEAFRVQFRADFLNLFNTPQFGGGGQWGSGIQNDPTQGDFGQVLNTRNSSRNIQLGLKVEF